MSSTILIATGLITLLHAGYSAMEFNSLRSENVLNEVTKLPLDISTQVLLGCFIALIGIILGTSSFDGIEIADELRKTPISSIQAQSSMRLTNHRGKYLFK